MINESEECEKQLFEEKISIINKKRDTLLLQLKELKKLQRQILDEYNKLSDSKKELVLRQTKYVEKKAEMF